MVVSILKTFNLRKFRDQLIEESKKQNLEEYKIGIIKTEFCKYDLDKNFVMNITIHNYKDCFKSGLVYYF